MIMLMKIIVKVMVRGICDDDVDGDDDYDNGDHSDDSDDNDYDYDYLDDDDDDNDVCNQVAVLGPEKVFPFLGEDLPRGPLPPAQGTQVTQVPTCSITATLVS